jgi:outer membrane translocation and assembly module TamA
MVSRVVRAVLLVSAASGWLWAGAVCAQALERYKPCSLPYPTLADEIRDLREDAARQQQKVVISEVRFATATQLPIAMRDQAAAELRRKEFHADGDWLNEALDALRATWQDHGYYKVELKAQPLLLSGPDPLRQFAILTVHVDEGLQYRLDEIRFNSANALPAETLRAMVPLQDGELFRVNKIREGLANIYRRYAELGFLDVTMHPETEVDVERQRITLTLEVDEQLQYRVSKVEVLGATPELERRLRSKVIEGDVYNSRRVEEFFEENKPLLPADVSVANMEIKRHAQRGLLFLRIDLRACLPPEIFFTNSPIR